MKRYKLLKDLPTFSKGDTFRLAECGDLVSEESGILTYAKLTLEKFNILDSGWFEEIPEDHKRWRAEEGERYWWVQNDGGVTNDCDDWVDIDDGRYELGNYFKTEEEAKKAAEWLKALTVLRDDTKGFKPNWNDPEQYKWFVSYNHTSRRLRRDSNFILQGGDLYFASEDEANDSIKKHERQWLTFFNCGGGNE